MTWGKVSDDLHSHPKWTGASVNAKALWVTALSYCSGYLTDGKVDAADHLPTLAVETFGLVPSSMRKAKAAASELAERGLWKTTDSGWRFHDWKDNNPMASQVRSKRKKDKRRDWLHKTDEGRELKRRVRERDGIACAWCAEPVRWGANRAPDGGTYEHIDPDGPNTLENVVVAHNHCNGRKSDRDAEEMGMKLYPGHPLTLTHQGKHESDDTTPTQSRPSRDSVANELPDLTMPGAGRVGFGSGTERFGSDLPPRSGLSAVPPIESVPPPDDRDYPHEGEAS